MNSLLEINTWSKNLGLLPIHLFAQQFALNSFVMLNGGYGDFCLEIQEDDRPQEEYNSYAWSSNTKNFVAINNEQVKVYNWKKNEFENTNIKTVTENFSKFYKYLLQNSYKTERDVVPTIIDIFRQFRNLTGESINPNEALNLLFRLIISLEDETTQIDNEKWGIDIVALPHGFDKYIEQLQKLNNSITPNSELIIRHSAGALFQEAQKEVIFFDKQLDLFGGVSSNQISKKQLYSSVHYTPPYLARTIVENSLSQINLAQKRSLKILDPACGSGEFLMETLKQLKERNYTGKVEIIGLDSSATAISTSNFLLTFEKRKVWKDNLSFNISLVDDSLKEDWGTDIDLLLMNPPFVSWEQMSKVSRNAVKGVLDSKLVGKPNQASAFFYKATLTLSDKGILGCVIPTSFLLLDAYKKLRRQLESYVDISLIGKLGNFVFENALTDISIIIVQKQKTEQLPFILWTKNEDGIVQDALRDFRKLNYSNSNQVIAKDYSIYKPLRFPFSEENWKPISFNEEKILKELSIQLELENLVPVKEVFNVQQGVRSGNNKKFKLSSSEYNKLPKEEKKFFRPALENKSIKNGVLLIENYIWYPYNLKGMIFSTEDELGTEAPFTYKNILFPNKTELISRARKDESNWWHLSEHRAWLRKSKPLLVSTEFGKSSSFAFDEKGAFAVERGNAWIPKKAFQDIDDNYFYLSIFSSNFFEKLLSIYSRQLAGGKWYDLGKKHTANIPIPNVHSNFVRNSIHYNKLVELGKEISDGNTHVKSLVDNILTNSFYPKINF